MLLRLMCGTRIRCWGGFSRRFADGELAADYRARNRPVDEYGVLTRNLVFIVLAGLDRDAIGGVIISSVVPPVNWTLGRDGAETIWGRERCSWSRA